MFSVLFGYVLIIGAFLSVVNSFSCSMQNIFMARTCCWGGEGEGAQGAMRACCVHASVQDARGCRYGHWAASPLGDKTGK